MTNSNKRLTVFQTNDYSTSMRKFFCPESYTSYSSSSSSSPCNFDAYAAKSIVTALAFEEDSMGSSSNRYSHQKTQHETKSRNPLTEQGESYYDCLEYAEDDASDHVQYDIGRLPLLLRGGSMMSNLAWTLTSTPTISDLESAASTGSTPPKQNQQPPTSYNSPPVESFRPPPPMELPDRFLRAGKMDPSEGRRRYEATLAWRREQRMDFILKEPFPNFDLIQANYPLFCHLTGHQGECVYYEKPPLTNLKLLKENGAGIDTMLRYYAMVTEFGWQWLDRSDSGKSVYIIDLKGIRLTDFAGEVIDFVRKASAFTGAHYPERSGCIFIINVPSWFKMIWNVVKPMIDEVTLKKIYILRGQKEIFTAMLERIPVQNIPPEYGGTSMPLGHSPEDIMLRQLMQHNNALTGREHVVCAGPQDCQFCRFQIARSY